MLKPGGRCTNCLAFKSKLISLEVHKEVMLPYQAERPEIYVCAHGRDEVYYGKVGNYYRKVRKKYNRNSKTCKSKNCIEFFKRAEIINYEKRKLYVV